MKLIIYTQVRENYGTAASPYWKMKGSNDYFIADVEPTAKDLYEAAAKRVVEVSDPMYEEWVIGADLVDDDYQTEFERSQLEYDGRIVFPCQEIEIEQ